MFKILPLPKGQMAGHLCWAWEYSEFLGVFHGNVMVSLLYCSPSVYQQPAKDSALFQYIYKTT